MYRKVSVFLLLILCFCWPLRGDEHKLVLSRCIYIISNLPEHRFFDDVDKSVYSKRMSYLLKNVVAKNFVEFGFDMGLEIDSVWYDCHQEWLDDDVHPEFSFKIGKVETERAEVQIVVYSPAWDRSLNLTMILVWEDGEWRLDDWLSPDSKKAVCERYLETPSGEPAEYSIFIDGVDSDFRHALRLYADNQYVIDYYGKDELKGMTDIPGAVSLMIIKTSDGVIHKLVGVEMLANSRR